MGGETLVSAVTCKYCAQSIYLALCRDGRYRVFDPVELPAGTPGAWAWRKRVGMEETDVAPGHGLHYCRGHHQGQVDDHRAYAVLTDLPSAAGAAQGAGEHPGDG